MKKGRFGFSLLVYPIVAFGCIILQQPLLGALIAVLAVILEKDTWCSNQCIQAALLAILLWIFQSPLHWLASLGVVPIFAQIFSLVVNILGVLVSLCAVLLSILAIIRASKGGEVSLPVLSTLAKHLSAAFLQDRKD